MPVRMCSSTAFTTHYRGATPRRRGATRKTSSTAQPRQERGLAATSNDADRGFAFDGVGRCAPPRRRRGAGSLEPGVRPQRGGGGGCARALAVYKPPPPKSPKKQSTVVCPWDAGSGRLARQGGTGPLLFAWRRCVPLPPQPGLRESGGECSGHT
jgi:hypothetical protein